MAADGVATIEVARRLGVSPDRVRRWRRRFEEQGLAGIGSVAPGRGRKPSLPEGTVAEIVRMTLTERPDDGSTHWSTRSLAEAVGVSRETVRKVWADHGLKPWKVDTFKLSGDPHFETKLLDVVGLYLNPPERAVVLELRREDPGPGPGPHPALAAHEEGARADDDPRLQAQRHHGPVRGAKPRDGRGRDRLPPLPRRRGRARSFRQIAKLVRRDQVVHVILDNLSAHKAPAVREWLARPRQRRWHLHFIPTPSSWLTLVERWFRELADRRLARGSFSSVQHLTDAITLWAERWNEDPKPFVWTAPAHEILTKVRRGREALNRHADSASDN